MEETWKEIPGYETLYEASNFGRIRTVEGKVTSSARFNRRVWKQRIMRQKITRNSRGRADARVCLWKDGKEQTYLVARLVALTWCDGYEDGMTVNHINGNSLDNRSSNLEWCTIQENIEKAFELGLCDSFCKKVLLKNEKTGEVIRFSSYAKAGKHIGRNVGYISNCIIKNRTSATSTSGERYTIIC